MGNYDYTIKVCKDLVAKNNLNIIKLGGVWFVYDTPFLDENPLIAESNIFELETELYKIDENLNR